MEDEGPIGPGPTGLAPWTLDMDMLGPDELLIFGPLATGTTAVVPLFTNHAIFSLRELSLSKVFRISRSSVYMI